MTNRTKKRPAKDPRPSKSKSKPKRRTVPLANDGAATRRSKLIELPSAPGSVPTAAAFNPAAMFEFMGRVTSVYVELPYRLAQCRSWMDLWKEQARFAQRILNLAEETRPELPGSRKRS
jgi:hypothetical protein